MRFRRGSRRRAREGHLHDGCQEDLVEIAGWIALDNPVRAGTFALELRAACETLADYPHRFQLLPSYESTGIRRRPHGNYLIFYWIRDEQTVEILHVLHGARDYERLLFPEAE